MDKRKFDAGFRALCVAVGFSMDSDQESFTLQVYYRKLMEKGFNDALWAKTVNRLIDNWRPEYGVKFPPVSEFLDISGLSPVSIGKKAHSAIKIKIVTVGGYNPLSLGEQHKHHVAAECIRRMGGWFRVCQSGAESWDKNKSKFLSLYEELFYQDDISHRPLLGILTEENERFLAQYNKKQITQ